MRIVIIGAGGRLGAALLREHREQFEVVGFNHSQLDLGALGQFGATLDPTEFHALINAAALTDVDYCEDHRAEALQLNAEAPRVLAEICRAKMRGSSTSARTTYSMVKRASLIPKKMLRFRSAFTVNRSGKGSDACSEANDQALVARVSWVFGPDRPSFIDAILKRAREEEKVAAVADKFSTPTYAPDIAEALRPLLLESRVSGLLHLANSGECSWQQHAQWALDCCHAAGIPMRARTVEALSLSDMKILSRSVPSTRFFPTRNALI